MISVTHLSKKYGSFTAVDDLSFDVREREVLGFLGPNGAGKTTTMRMLTGFLPPSHGRVRVGGFDLYDHPVQAKQRLGYLPENPPVYPEMTVRRYLRFVAELKDVPPFRMRAAIDLAIERTRLGDVADKRISKLSKGFRQRVGLAQAIVHEPPVLVLDEPTSSLDPKQRFEVRELIAELKGKHTVILSTRILPEVSGVADRVFIINRGKVMAVDTPARLGDRLRSTSDTTFERVDLVSQATEFRAGRDRPGPFLIAVATSIPRGSRDAALPEPRIVVTGDSDFLANGLLTWTANRDLAIRMIAWLAGEEEAHVISVGERQNRRVTMTERCRTAMCLVNLGLLPLLPLVAGLIQFRRSRR